MHAMGVSMFGQEYLVVRVNNDNGEGALLAEIVVLGVLGYVLYSVIGHVVDHPWQYAWIHVMAANFYYWTAVVPFLGIAVVWHVVGSLTPWENLNLVLAVLAVPTYIVLAFVLIGGTWMALTSLCRMPALGAYFLPGVASLFWLGVQWLFA